MTARSSPSSRRTRSGPSSPSGRPLHRQAMPFVQTCFAEAARERAGEAELVIANHALYFADVALRGSNGDAGVLPEHDAVIFDEAHRLEESAAAWLGGRVSSGGLRRFASDIERACREARRPAPARALEKRSAPATA